MKVGWGGWGSAKDTEEETTEDRGSDCQEKSRGPGQDLFFWMAPFILTDFSLTPTHAHSKPAAALTAPWRESCPLPLCIYIWNTDKYFLSKTYFKFIRKVPGHLKQAHPKQEFLL